MPHPAPISPLPGLPTLGSAPSAVRGVWAVPMALALFGLGLALSLGSAQAAHGQEVFDLSQDETLFLGELGAICELGDEGLEVRAALPKETRPEENRSLDIQRGDVILMINGQRVRELEAARKIYGEVEVGAEVGLAVARGGHRRILRFTKKDPAEVSLEALGEGGGGLVVRRSAAGAGGSGGSRQLQPVPSLGVVVSPVAEGKGHGAEVSMVLPVGSVELKEKDVILAVAGVDVADPAALAEALEGQAAGGRVEVKVRRGDEIVVLEQTVSNAQVRVRAGGSR